MTAIEINFWLAASANQLGRVWQVNEVEPNQLGEIMASVKMIGPNQLGRSMIVWRDWP